jgi:Sulfotransferase family
VIDAKLRNRVKVLYIAGQGRSGSTILGDTLGQMEGFTHVGELLEVWGILKAGRVRCGCGVPVPVCGMWKEVLNEAYGGLDESLISRMLEFRNLDACDRACLRDMISGERTLRRRLAKPLAEIERLYRAIQKVFNCEVIVESSKHPMYAYLLKLIDGIDTYVLHLNRDPRASAYSFLRKHVKDGNLIWATERSPLNASLMWNYKNSVIEVLSRRFGHRPLHLRYEDFVADPRKSLQGILRFADVNRSSLPLHDHRSLNLEAQHSVSGNPSRFVTGKVELREDQSWKTGMKTRDKILVTAATWPLRVKYGYTAIPHVWRDAPEQSPPGASEVGEIVQQ